MKKWIGALCSALAGALSLVFLCIPAFSIELIGVKKYSGWKLITNKEVDDFAKSCGLDGVTALTWYRIFAWILVVLAIVLIVVAVLQILANLNVIKVPAIIDTIGKYALIALAVVAVLALVANIGIRAEFVDFYKDKNASEATIKKVKEALTVGASLWVVAGINLVAAACANLFAKKAK